MQKIQLIVAALLIICLFVPGELVGQGCMEAGDEEGVSIKGFFQSQFDYYLVEDDDEYSFTMRRVRVAFIGSIPYDVSYYLCLEVSPFLGNPGMLDGIITYTRFAPYAKFSIGQFKAPFSLEQNTSCAGLHTILRSKVVDNLGAPQRDLGLMLLGAHKELLSYSIAYMNGYEKGKEDENSKKDVVGRVVLSPVKLMSIGGSFRYGIVGGAEDGKKIRYGAELQLKHNDFLVQSEYIIGKDIGNVSGGGGGCSMLGIPEDADTVSKSGFFVQGMYMTKWNIQPVIKYEFWEPDTDVDGDIENVITYGINYFLNDWTRLQINYLYCAEETGEAEYENDRILAQLQVKF